MVCGTTSDAGKSTIVAGLCRLLARQGVSVAPFKGQNMSLNSVVTTEGAEIGRAQWIQAVAARVEPETAMNPVLLKPTSERSSQVIVMGRPRQTQQAADYQRSKADLVDVVDGALADLRQRFDVVICEGAGSPAEINLLDHDIVNLGLARRAGVPAVVVGDIHRGGVFAHLYGTVAILPDELRRCVRAFIINMFRGDSMLLGDAMEQLEARCGVPTLGVLPFVPGLVLDAEDSLHRLLSVLPAATAAPEAEQLDVVVLRLPRLSNFTDFDPLLVESGVAVRFVDHPSGFGDPDLIVLPGTKSTVADLEWVRASGLFEMLQARRRAASPPVVLGVCGGFQMLGQTIEDPDAVESEVRAVPGLGWLPLVTRFAADKTTRLRQGSGPGGVPVGATRSATGAPPPAQVGSSGWRWRIRRGRTTSRARATGTGSSSAPPSTACSSRTASGGSSSRGWPPPGASPGTLRAPRSPPPARTRSTAWPTCAPPISISTRCGGWSSSAHRRPRGRCRSRSDHAAQEATTSPKASQSGFSQTNSVSPQDPDSDGRAVTPQKGQMGARPSSAEGGLTAPGPTACGARGPRRGR
jgi:adenosylcobyric acid synthase